MDRRTTLLLAVAALVVFGWSATSSSAQRTSAGGFEGVTVNPRGTQIMPRDIAGTGFDSHHFAYQQTAIRPDFSGQIVDRYLYGPLGQYGYFNNTLNFGVTGASGLLGTLPMYTNHDLIMQSMTTPFGRTGNFLHAYEQDSTDPFLKYMPGNRPR